MAHAKVDLAEKIFSAWDFYWKRKELQKTAQYTLSELKFYLAYFEKLF